MLTTVPCSSFSSSQTGNSLHLSTDALLNGLLGLDLSPNPFIQLRCLTHIVDVLGVGKRLLGWIHAGVVLHLIQLVADKDQLT